MAMRDVPVGNSQLKPLCRSRLRLCPSVETCTFSFGGYDAVHLASAVRRLNLKPADFVILYVGGNDLARPNASPQAICVNFKALVLLLLRDVAPVVLVAKVLPRCFASTDAEASRRLLNRNLTAALKRMPCVGILNPDHRFLDAMKAPKRHLFAADGYHLSADEGIEELAEVFVRGLAKFYGAGILAPFSGAPARYIIHQCHQCGSKGHWHGDCYEYCRP
ncbi:uncharacterized protein LOC144115943 [Amblyomma americanum]